MIIGRVRNNPPIAFLEDVKKELSAIESKKTIDTPFFIKTFVLSKKDSYNKGPNNIQPTTSIVLIAKQS